MTSRREYDTAGETARTNVTSRRQFLRRAAAFGFAVPSLSALLAGCEVNIGADDDTDEPDVEPEDEEEPTGGDTEVEPDQDDEDDDTAAEADVDPTEDDDGERDESADEIEIPELDLETMEAETPDGALQAQRADNSYVGEIDEGRVIGVAFTSEVDIAEDPYDDEEIIVRLYDRQESAVFRGDIDEDGAASLESFDGSDFEATVDLVMEDDVVTGSVTFGDGEPVSFTAEAATGDAGLYWVENDDENAEILSVDWVVLPDGRQWGVICWPPTFNNPFCGVRRL